MSASKKTRRDKYWPMIRQLVAANYEEEEQGREMELDRAYWAPLGAELEALRRERRRTSR